ncbi:MAG: hypothetical protein RIS17_573, partial [Pseudomonadota bacterium]
PGVSYSDKLGRFPTDDAGRIAPALYASGWARRGPSGTIGTNRPDGFSVVEAMVADGIAASSKAGPAGLDALLASRGVKASDFAGWHRIDAAETAAARAGAPREKIVDVREMLKIAL